MALGDLWAWELLLAAFAGGAFGAAVGALPSFVLAGVLVVVGELYALVARTTDAVATVDVTGSIAFGVVLGPHVAFGGGAAAVAYAHRRGYLDTEFDYHPAKEVTRGLGSRPDVLAVGGAFGVLGYWVATLSGSLSLPVDPVALGVVASALAHRLLFGYSVFGAAPRHLLDMSPFERVDEAERTGQGEVVRTDGGAAEAASGAASPTRPEPGRRVEPWLPYQYRWSHVATLGVVVGLLGAYVAYLTASAFLAFGISVVALAFVVAGAPEIPVTHHMSLPASTAVLASVDAPFADLTPSIVAGAIPLGDALLLGAGFGLLGALLGEVGQRVFYAHSETHLDPPAASIVLTSVLIALLAMLGALPTSAWVPVP